MSVEAARRQGLPADLPAVLVAAVVAAQVLYPLVGGDTRQRLTIVVVVLVATASLSQAAATCGWRVAAGVLAVCAGIGFSAEVLGVHTGVPFGRYSYAPSLGPQLWSVPVVIVLAWPMLAWPAALAARRLVTGFGARVAVGAWGLASWDLFLDPQMVAAGRWRWHSPTPHLPGVGTVPVTNYLGWLAVALVISAALQWMLGDRAVADGLALVLYIWTYLSSIVALAVFLHLAAAAAFGALGMGLVAVPLMVRMARSR